MSKATSEPTPANYLPPPLSTVPEAASYLRVCRATVYRLILRGELKTRRIGKRLRITGESLASVGA